MQIFKKIKRQNEIFRSSDNNSKLFSWSGRLTDEQLSQF